MKITPLGSQMSRESVCTEVYWKSCRETTLCRNIRHKMSTFLNSKTFQVNEQKTVCHPL